MCFLFSYSLVCGGGGSFSHFGCSFIFLGLGDFVVVLGLLFEKALGGGKNMIKIYLNFKNVFE